MTTTPSTDMYTTTTVNSVDDLRQIFDHGATPQMRSNYTQSLTTSFPEHMASSNFDTDALAARVSASVFGDHSLSADDTTALKTAFPMAVLTAKIDTKTIPANTVWNLGTSTSPVSIEVGTLTMEPGSSIVIANTVLSLKVDTLIRQTGGSGPNYDLAILGVAGASGSTGASGQNGQNGPQGSGGTCQSGGGIAGDNGGAGGNGTGGGNGGIGNQGGNGLASLTANITFGNISGAPQFVIYTASGAGGQGGAGGVGGSGGSGGNGGEGATCACEHTDGGNGGSGGSGGQGGQGGQGGNGVNGQDVYVTVPSGSENKIIKTYGYGTPGNAGVGGAGGGAGNPGYGGGGGGKSGCPQGSGGSNGQPGGPGSPGPLGNPGTITGQPGTIYVNGQ